MSFDSVSFLFSGQSYSWYSMIIWSQVASDALIALVCFLIPLMFFWFRRTEIRIRRSYFVFAALAFGFGVIQILEAIAWWQPMYPLQTLVKVITAMTAVATLILVWPYIPQLFRVRSSRMLEEKNRQLELANDKFNFLLEGSGIGVFEWHDVHNLKSPLDWSSRMFELLGFKPNSFEPNLEFYISLIHPEDREKVVESIQQIEFQKEILISEYRLRVLSGYRWFQSKWMVRTQGGKHSHFIIGSLEDIHDQKISEEKIRSMNQTLEEEIRKRTLQLEMANRAKTRFLANMSHEMRTPLGLVLGFAELLTENKNLDREAKEYIGLIIKNGEILSRVINDLLDLSKIEAGKLRFQYTRLKLKSLIQDFEKNFAERALKKRVRLSFQNLCSDDEVVVTDEIRLKQIVYNLLSNALKFTDHGSVHVTLGKRDKMYYIDVVDTGIGIPEAEKNTIFNEYARGEMVDSGKSLGTGLGLRLAQNLALALGGAVELVSSQVGKGSHFRMTFVSDEEKLQKQVERKQDVDLTSQLRDFDIFVLDDNEDNIRLAEIFLRKLGCRVRGFTSAKSLFAELVSNTPDLILLDIHMPEMNGFEVFTYLRNSGYKNPIWALTAYSLNEDIQTILEYGFDDYIRKPVSIDSMKKKLTYELRERMND